ncbi:MAG: hypothetical protein K1X65_22180 [Caldilineales bacterium]|nr:hypothetical protein [Caldilineales bacterium]
MTTIPLEQTNKMTARWLRFLSRWALVMVLVGLALLGVFIGGIGFAASDNALGAEYSELLQAVRVPVIYRVFTSLDALGWAMMGGALLIIAVSLRNRAPIRSLLIAACGVGLLSGVLGGVMRLVGISTLAEQYASAAPAQQAALLPSMLTLYALISAHFVVGDFLAGMGWLLVATVGFGLAAFPRWLAAWFAIAGLLSLLQGATSAVGAFSFPILLFTIVVGVLGLHAAIAVAFWQPSPSLVSAIADAP